MQTLNYIVDAQGNKKAMIFNLSDNLESKILNYWLNEPNEKRNTVNLYFAQFLYEMATDDIEKRELKHVINQLKPTENKDSEFVAYTTDGKGLTQKEYTEIILTASDDCSKGINTVSHTDAMERINSKIEMYENNMA